MLLPLGSPSQTGESDATYLEVVGRGHTLPFGAAICVCGLHRWEPLLGPCQLPFAITW